MKEKTNMQIANSVSIHTIVWNILLSIFKFVAGVLANSGAMISDAVHSASDVLSTFIVIFGVSVANKESDKEHPYGHERMECVAAIILAVILCGTGLGIGYSGLLKVFADQASFLPVPGSLALFAAGISIIVKEIMFWYTRAAAVKIRSGALMADAWHHRSDALSSVGSLAGIMGARMGFPIFDPIASIMICLFILKAGFNIFKDSIAKMTDTSCGEKMEQEMKTVIAERRGVIAIDRLRTRLFGDKIYVELEIQADGNKTLTETHKIAQDVHDALEAEFSQVKHCMVHVNPKTNESVSAWPNQSIEQEE